MIVLFIFLNLLMVLAANLVSYRYCHEKNFSLQLLTLFIVYAAQITITVLLLGVVVKNLGIPAVTILNSTISIAIILGFRRILKKSISHTYKKTLSFGKYLVQTRDYFLYVILLLFMAQVVFTAVKIYYLPPHVWDSFAYHLHPVVEWIQQNMIPSSIDSPVTRMNRNPLGLKVMHFWFVRFFNDITWIELPQFLYGLLVILASYFIMLKLEIRRHIALRYAVLIYFIPLLLLESRTCQDHLALTGILMAVLVYALEIFYGKSSSRLPLLFPALALGILMGMKVSAPHVILIFIPAILISKGFRFAPVKTFFQERKWGILSGLFTVFALGGYWYLRGNKLLPLYWERMEKLVSQTGVRALIVILAVITLLILPALLKKKIPLFNNQWMPVKVMKHRRLFLATAAAILVVILGITLLNNWATVQNVASKYRKTEPIISGSAYAKEYPGLKEYNSPFAKNLLVFPFRVTDIGKYTAYSPDFLMQSGFGIQFFAFGLIGFAAAGFFIFRKKYRTGIVGFVFFYAVLLQLSYYTYYYSEANYRMFMFFPVLGLILWAFLQEHLKLRSIYKKYIDVLIIGMLIFNAATCLVEGNFDIYRFKTLLTLEDRKEATAIKYSPLFEKGDDWQFIDSYIPAKEPIGYLGYIDSWVFPYFDNRLKRRVHYLRTLRGFTLKPTGGKTFKIVFTPAFKASLKELNIHYIHVNPQGVRLRINSGQRIAIHDENVLPVTRNLYYFKW